RDAFKICRNQKSSFPLPLQATEGEWEIERLSQDREEINVFLCNRRDKRTISMSLWGRDFAISLGASAKNASYSTTHHRADSVGADYCELSFFERGIKPLRSFFQNHTAPLYEISLAIATWIYTSGQYPFDPKKMLYWPRDLVLEGMDRETA